MIVALGTPNLASVAKASTTTIPIVFLVGEDPVKLGLVASLSRPGGNMTGVNLFNNEINAKRLTLLRELAPAAMRVAVLVNPANAAIANTTAKDVETAAHAMGLLVQVHNAGTSQEIDATFATFGDERPDAFFVAGDPFFNSRRVHLFTRRRIIVPPTYGSRAYADIGGLMSYGTDMTESYRQSGVYAGRILKGAKPAELPVVQASKFELVINAQTARMLGLKVPPTLLARADEVIE